ncbi:MAG TPA: 50S ribosomal protein L25 [Flavobacteriales bacterium]|nr:50S ribosomal protein L25 [Flavobacteriales bacterium]
MKNVELIGTKREIKGTSGAQAIRRTKQVPCVLYGGKETMHFSVDERALDQIIHSPLAHRVELNINGQKHLAVLQDKQFQPVTDAVIHADFLEVESGKDARLNMTVRLKGQSIGARKGGKMSQSLRNVRVKGNLDAMPEVIELDITGLDVGESIRVRDVKVPGVTLLEKPESVVVAVKASKKAAETPAAGADKKDAKK